ncbi:hypothetical protein FA09DRAFT_161804 [Tilletiopsis washingtonensis]|uniref:Transcription factor IIIC putative zinc-finger domain-containing protein n=1 Tax=Tilletiopsis washingtonensis TaxID=58919 RepID=A0A316Z3W2_9BASI|nr:hypothetical protein FA09DRAFT_161804 [Tilletiopsis washingtonensis]PWN94875.1 hypothetical protein FA09DRAFT_161804 [Tilletiopsis washingtonensis]
MRSQASKLLQSFLTKAQAKATEQAWTAQAQTDVGVDTGETCPVCSASVALSLQHADLAKCASGHIWSRCSVTLRLLETGARSCGWCGAQAALAPPELRDTGDHNAAGEAMELDAPEQHQEGSELSELKRQTRCGICGGPWCVLGG